MSGNEGVSFKAIYRLCQFWRGFHAEVTAAELQEVTAILPVAAFTLFQQLPLDGQRHSINVLRTLQATGTVEHDLAVAALLHDVGKVAATNAGLEINLWVRGPLVLLEQLGPSLLTRLSSPCPNQRWRYLLYVHLAHPQIGAEWAEAAGCSVLSCWLIAHHQDALEDSAAVEQQLLAQLQWADNRN